MSEDKVDMPRLDSQAALFTPRQIYAASFLGSPIAAAWFISRNFHALSSHDSQKKALWLGVVATVAAMIVAFILPSKTPNVVWPIAYSAAIYFYAEHLFGTAVKSHLQGGGRRGSWWHVVGVSALCFVTLLAMLVGVILTFPNLFAD
jgi:hypothetical protein